ncbi:ACT domain-containing protein [Fibrisoma limi]|uniref:ACT domain-containing protein n=1 Tax=Fibrisoma limi TaxID=663275 RepID=UPI001181C12B
MYDRKQPAIQNQPRWQTVFQITGFDRLNFVGDVTNAIPQDEHCRILNLSFEADGVRAFGHLTVQANDQHHFLLITNRLRSVKGLVSITQIN